MSCPVCDCEFDARNIRQVYCSPKCRTKAFRDSLVPAKPEFVMPERFAAPPPWKHNEIPVAIVAHPDRAEWVHQLQQQTQAEVVFTDHEGYGCEGNHLRALAWLAEGNCPWSVVVEDDALPVHDFRRQLHAALAQARTPIVSLYLGRFRPPHWQSSIARAIAKTREKDACFLTATHLLHGVGYAIRTDLIPELLLAASHLTRTEPIDEAIGIWARERFPGRPTVSYTWPSLLDHRDGPTTQAHPDGQPRRDPRVAWCADWREQWHPTATDIPAPRRGVDYEVSA